MAILGVVAIDEVRQILEREGITLSREVLVRPEVVDPEVLRSGISLRRFRIEEEDIRFHALGVEDAHGQARHR